MAERVLILGASARAAAASARRAGLDPFAIDLFADRDTKQICEVLRCPFEDYPEGLFRLARTAPPMPWMYTGGLENYPELVGELAKERELWGNHGRWLENIRDPFRFHAICEAHGYHSPSLCPFGRPKPDNDVWLTKHSRSAGGIAIREYIYGDEHSIGSDYIQRFMRGAPMSALFMMTPWRSYFLGGTKQLAGEQWLHSERFAYCGNIGPIEVEAALSQSLRRLGGIIAQYGPNFGLVGLDFIVNEEAHVIPLEVNPRYTASVEVHELGFKERYIDWHRMCSLCMDDVDDGDEEWREPANFVRHTVIGKAIYYAPARLTFPGSGPWDDSLARAADVWTRPDFADIPHPGDVIEAGQPILTILTDADTEAGCLAKLKARAAELDRLFGFATLTPVPSPLEGEG